MWAVEITTLFRGGSVADLEAYEDLLASVMADTLGQSVDDISNLVIAETSDGTSVTYSIVVRPTTVGVLSDANFFNTLDAAYRATELEPFIDAPRSKY